jgi:hypothetical protein
MNAAGGRATLHRILPRRKASHMRLRLSATVLATAALALPASAVATTPVTQHLTDGEQLVTNLGLTAWPAQGTINKYDADDADAGVTWGTAGVGSGWSADTKCARFVRELFRHAYSWATDPWFTQQFGSTSPNTEQLRTNMAAAQHFDVIDTVTALQAGDLVMFDKATGVDHTVVVRQLTSLPLSPQPNGLEPQADTVQYAVQVLDSTSNPHGYIINGTNHPYKQWADTRRLDGTGSSVTEYDGAGYGWMVLYANAADGKVYGWRWGVNESAISKISEGHTVMFARATDEA